MNSHPSESTIETAIDTDADKVLASLSSGDDGIFQRDSIVTEGEAGDKGRVVLWTFKLHRVGRVVEWLFRMTTERNCDGDGYMLGLNTLEDENELPEYATAKLETLRSLRKGSADPVVEGLMKNCVVILRNMKYGQSSFFLKGHIGTAKALDKLLDKSVDQKMSKRMPGVVRRMSTVLETTAAMRFSSQKLVLNALDGVVYSIFKEHEDSARVDNDRHRVTVGEIMTANEEGGIQLKNLQERGMMEEAKKMLARGKSWKCISHEGVNPIRISKVKQEGNSVPWCKAEAVIHTSAKRLLSYLLNFDSIDRMKEHNKKHGRLSRCMHVGGQGGINDARHFFYCLKIPKARRKRRFEVRAVWEHDKGGDAAVAGHDDGRAVYRFAWCPANQLSEDDGYIDRIKAECGFDDGSSFLAGTVLANTKGIYELKEVAENITGNLAPTPALRAHIMHIVHFSPPPPLI